MVLKSSPSAGLRYICYSLLCLCLPFSVTSYSQLPRDVSSTNVRTIYEFPKSTWIENLAVRSNGSILVTELTKPNLWQVNPFNQGQPPWLVHTFPGYLGLLGIAEIAKDVFAVITGNFSIAGFKTYPGTYALWKVDLTNNGIAQPRVSKLANIPQANFLNGMAYLPSPANALLMSDSDQGLVYRYNLTSNKTDVAINVPLMKKCFPTALEGINGIRVQNNVLHFNNAFCGYYVQLPIYPNGTARAGAQGTIIARSSLDTFYFDDLAVASDGSVYLATITENIITWVAPNGVARVLAGDLNSSAILNPTSAQFGRTTQDKNTLYVTTGGGLAAPLNGTTILGGQVVAVTL